MFSSYEEKKKDDYRISLIETNMNPLDKMKAAREKFPFRDMHPVFSYLLYLQGILKMNYICKQLSHNTVFSELLID